MHHSVVWILNCIFSKIQGHSLQTLVAGVDECCFLSHKRQQGESPEDGEMIDILGHLSAHNRLNWVRRISRGW